jgi:hypothetical protein
MPTRDVLIYDFYRAMAAGGSRDTITSRAYRLFIDIARACGYSDQYEHELAYKGIAEVASEDTDTAAKALTVYALKISNTWTVSVADQLADMTAPSVGACLEELVRSSKGDWMYEDVKAARNRHRARHG